MYLKIITNKLLLSFVSPLFVEANVLFPGGGTLKGSSMWHRESIDPSPNEKFLLSFAIRSIDLNTAEQALFSVSDPLSPEYAQYWTHSEVAAQFLPAPDAIQSVSTWLYGEIMHHDIHISRDQSWIHANSSIHAAETLLQAKYHLYRHRESSEKHLACLNYTLPDSLRPHIDLVTPTTDLGAATLRDGSRNEYQEHTQISESLIKRQANGLAICSQLTTPACIRALYGIPLAESVHEDNTLGVYQPAWASWLPADLDTFFSYFRPEMIGHRPPIIPINGGYWQDRVQGLPFNAEANLDMQITMSLSAPERVVNFQVGDMYHPGTLNSLLAAFDGSYCSSLNSTIDGAYPNFLPGGYNKSADCGTVQSSQVLSISYAANEVNFTPEYLRRQCTEFLKLGLMGVSVVVAAADCGPAGHDCQCVNPNTGQEDRDMLYGNFNPTTPASCPYVTVVGGTALPAGAAVTAPEVAWQLNVTYLNSTIPRTSGGGFSNIFQAPPWQHSAVKRYIAQESESLKKMAGKFNPKGRATPDLSANAANFATVRNGTLRTIHGTSASAPLIASMITLINGKRLSIGEKPVGFLNPVLYAHPHIFKDVVSGGNSGCGGQAFRAAAGWDPVTGLGTPDYQRMEKVFMELP